MAKVIWTEPALDQVREILEFVAKKSSSKGEQLSAKLFHAVDLLETNPRMGRQVPEFRLAHLRELIVNSHRILYLLRNDICSIVTVVHSSRDLANLIRPEDLETYP